MVDLRLNVGDTQCMPFEEDNPPSLSGCIALGSDLIGKVKSVTIDVESGRDRTVTLLLGITASRAYFSRKETSARPKECSVVGA